MLNTRFFFSIQYKGETLGADIDDGLTDKDVKKLAAMYEDECANE